MLSLRKHFSVLLNPVVNSAPGVVSALQKCMLEAGSSVYDTLDHSLTVEVLGLLESISVLLLGVLYGGQDACATEEGMEQPAETILIWG